MHRLAKIKYPAIEGCLQYLVMRSNWIDHWVKAIQSGLVNTLAKGMAQSYTDLAAQHAVARAERFVCFFVLFVLFIVLFVLFVLFAHWCVRSVGEHI